MEILPSIVEIFKALGLTNPAEASGWIVAILALTFTVWRVMTMDKKYENYVDKISEVIEKQEQEWRALVRRQDEITNDMLEDSTKTMTVLAEKINTLQMFLLQLNKH